MAFRTYVAESDLTSTVFSDFNMSGYVAAANDHIDYLSYSYDVNPSGEASTAINSVLKEYGTYYSYRQAALDKVGANNVELGADDKYLTLYEIFNSQCERLRKFITPAMFSNDADSSVELASTQQLFRG